MFTVTIETTFTAEHQLTLGKAAKAGKEPLHSHDWIVRVAVAAEELDPMGLAIDFNRLKVKLSRIIAPFTGVRLEELECFKKQNTSAENLARYIFERLEPLLPQGVELRYVEVMEAPGCWAKYSAKPI